MEDNILLDELAKLLADLKSRVADFIEFLLTNRSVVKEEINKPVFGSGKGMFKMMLDFDEPIEDFKEYM